MAKKKKAVRPVYKPTKRHLSHLQQQRRRRRIILSIGIAVISVVILLVGAGVYSQWYLPEYKPLHQTVLEVNGTKFNMDYFIEALEFYSGGQAQYIELLVGLTAENIQQGELIRQQALELGYSVNDKEVDRELEENDLPVNRAARDIVETRLLIEKMKEEYFEPQIPLSGEHRHVLAMFLEGEHRAAEIRDRIEAGEDFAVLAGELSLDSVSKEKSGDLGFKPQGVLDGLLNTSVVDSFAFDVEVGLVSQPLYDGEKSKNLGYWLIEVLEKKADPEEVHVQAILLSSEEEALSVKARLEAGENFGDLAAELSQLAGADEDRGDLGSVSRGTQSQAFEKFVFSIETELNTVSQPIGDESQTTEGGCWLIKVLDKDPDKQLSDEDRELLLSYALTDWVSSVTDDPANEVVNYLDDEMRAFAIERALAG